MSRDVIFHETTPKSIINLDIEEVSVKNPSPHDETLKEEATINTINKTSINETSINSERDEFDTASINTEIDEFTTPNSSKIEDVTIGSP